MKIYPKNRMYITFPPLPEDATGCLVNGVPFNKEAIDASNKEALGYDRTMARLAVSRAKKRLQELVEK